MTLTVVVMIVIGIIFIFASFFVSESFSKKQENFSADLLTVNDNYEFSEREKGIIKRKVEDAIAQQARDILYETNESLSNMANEKTLALGDYAVTVCEEIERNHKEVMFLYSMLEDKQKDIMNTVGEINKSQEEVRNTIKQAESTLKNTEKVMNIKNTVVTTGIEKVAKSSKGHSDVHSESKEEEKETEKQEDKVFVDDNKDETMEQNSSLEVEDKQTVELAADDEKVIEEVESIHEEAEIEDLLDSLDDVNLDPVLEEEFEQSSNSNNIILEMYRNGDSILTIAKELGLGVGEVKLVIDLYQGE